MPEDPGPRELRGPLVPHRPLAARGRRLHRQARRPDRHRLHRHPGGAGDRRDGRAPHRVPAHRRTTACRPATRRSTPEFKALTSKATTPRDPRRHARRRRTAIPSRIADRSALDVDAGGAPGALRGGLGEGRPAVPRAPSATCCIDKAANDTAAEFIRDKIREIVQGPGDGARCSPTSTTPIAAKRPPIDTDYFETFNRDNVSLVDVRADADRGDHADRHPHAATREYALDIIVFATGFDAMTGPLLQHRHPRPRRPAAAPRPGRPGRAPTSACRSPGFPNLFTITGPGQPVGAVQHAGRDRAARRLDHRLHRASCARNGLDAHRARARGRWTRWVRARQRGGERDAAAAGAALLVPGRQRAGQAARLHALCRRHGRYRDICDEVARTGYAGFRLER